MHTIMSNDRFDQIKLFFGLFMLSAMVQIFGSDEPMDYQFPREEYEHYMKLIQEIDPAVHATLEKCEAALGAPCIEEAVDIPDMIDDGSDETQGYPIMVIKSWQKEFPGNETAQKELLAYPVKWYKEKASMVVSPITYEERQKFLQGIKAVDPTAYDAIVKVDPTGENHIKRHYGVGGNNASMLPSPIDGLPEFHIDATIVLNPWNEMLFTVAHELSHYVLGHFFEAYQLSHRVLGTEKEGAQSFDKKGQKISGQLPFKQTFENARQRVKENECDRMAIIDFGINIDNAIASAKKSLADAKEYDIQHPQKETFQSTHPFWSDRIKHLESLRSEVELHKTQKRQRKSINWEQLAQKYLKKYSKK